MVSTLKTITDTPQSQEIALLTKTAEDTSKIVSERVRAIEALSKWIWAPQKNVSALTDTQKGVLDILLRLFNKGHKFATTSADAEKIQCTIARQVFRRLLCRPEETKYVYTYLSSVYKALFRNPQVSNSIMNAVLY